MKNNKPLYLCDKRKCGKACGECRHTTDIAHAENFELVGGAYVEKKRKQAMQASKTAKNSIVVDVEISTLLDGKPVDLEYLRQAVKEKMVRDARRC